MRAIRRGCGPSARRGCCRRPAWPGGASKGPILLAGICPSTAQIPQMPEQRPSPSGHEPAESANPTNPPHPSPDTRRQIDGMVSAAPAGGAPPWWCERPCWDRVWWGPGCRVRLLPSPGRPGRLVMGPGRRAWARARGRRRRSSPIRATSAVSMATSAPMAPRAMPTSAVARAGASLTPSPTIAVGRVARIRATMADLSSGRRSAWTCVIPAWAAKADAVRALSPVSVATA
jgi:hypothetical protein